MTTRLESLKRCRCAVEGNAGWCGNEATAEDGLCDFCRDGCGQAGMVVLTPEQVLRRDRVEIARE
jgi:hypothetical protein